MKAARLNRLFAPSGNCFDVAIDHGMFNEPSFLGGIENMTRAIQTIAAAAPDAIQLPPGTAPILQAIPGKTRPALVLRTDIANVYGTPLPTALFSEVITRGLTGSTVRKNEADPSSRYCAAQFISVRCGMKYGAPSRSHARTCPFAIRFASTYRRLFLSPLGCEK